jgi:alpha-L-arabinofuranosidase
MNMRSRPNHVVVYSRYRLFRFGLVLFAALCIVGWSAAGAADDGNLLPNPSFETVTDGAPAGWDSRTWAGSGEFGHVAGGRTGERCLFIESSEGGDLSWQAKVAVQPATTYRLSGWIRTEELEAGTGRGAQLNVHELQRSAATPAVTGTSDWVRVETIVRTGEQREITVNCLFGGWGQSTGRAWFDDVSLEEIDLARFTPTVTLDAGRTGEPINPFLYGQFIEHLGRCIYGGIWAEMLEDRKFYFPITPDYRPYRGLLDTPFPVVGASPWEILGAADSVQMTTEDSFVGRQTPHIDADSGIRQRDLGIVQGKAYEGYVWLKRQGPAASVAVSLVWGEGASERQTVSIRSVADAYEKHPLRFTAGASTDHAMLEIRVSGGLVRIGTASLMPADNVRGMRADTLALLKELDAPMYRWPGGNFVSGYDWRDGIGDRDRRPPRRNPAWTGVEHNDFGMDEFLDFCRELGTEPMIAVNTGFGDAYSAAQQVEYCNALDDTVGGGWRIENGHPEPYGVRYWCVGNEMWGPWQLGFMQLRHYTLKHSQVAEAMWEVDRSLQLVGSGQLGTINRQYDPNEKRTWTEGMLRECADYMNLIAEHFYRGKNRDNLLAHVNQLAESVREKAEGHRRLQAELGLLENGPMPVAMTEWNYWYQPYVYGELGCQYDLADALGVAVGLHEYFRHSDLIQMAHYAQTVNVIGCIKTTKTDAFFDATALPLLLYRREFGSVPLEVRGDHALVGLDVSAAWTEDRSAVTVAVVNPNTEAKTVQWNVTGVKLAEKGVCWVIAGDDPAATNRAGQQELKIVEQPFQQASRIEVQPLSITVVRLPVKSGDQP